MPATHRREPESRRLQIHRAAEPQETTCSKAKTVASEASTQLVLQPTTVAPSIGRKMGPSPEFAVENENQREA